MVDEATVRVVAAVPLGPVVEVLSFAHFEVPVDECVDLDVDGVAKLKSMFHALRVLGLQNRVLGGESGELNAVCLVLAGKLCGGFLMLTNGILVLAVVYVNRLCSQVEALLHLVPACHADLREHVADPSLEWAGKGLAGHAEQAVQAALGEEDCSSARVS